MSGANLEINPWWKAKILPNSLLASEEVNIGPAVLNMTGLHDTNIYVKQSITYRLERQRIMPLACRINEPIFIISRSSGLLKKITMFLGEYLFHAKKKHKLETPITAKSILCVDYAVGWCNSFKPTMHSTFKNLSRCNRCIIDLVPLLLLHRVIMSLSTALFFNKEFRGKAR